MADFCTPGTSLRSYFGVRKPGEQSLGCHNFLNLPVQKNVQPNRGISLPFVSFREKLNRAAVFKLTFYRQNVLVAKKFLCVPVLSPEFLRATGKTGKRPTNIRIDDGG